VLINVGNLPLGVSPSADYYLFMSQLDSIVHFMKALAISCVLVQIWPQRRTLGLLLFLIFAWEVFEFFTQDYLAREPVTQRIQYYSDMLDDIALGTAGALIGVYFASDEPLNTAKAMKG
jgi:hypothetical protein